MQPVATVATNVKYHSSQETTDQFIAENVFKSINHKKVVVALDLAEDRVMAEDQATEDRVTVEVTAEVHPDSAEVHETKDQEKCLRQPAVIVETNVRFHSSQETIDLFIAENVFKITDKISKSF